MLSWSGERSHFIAQALYEWIPKVIQKLDGKLWISSEDIRKGSKWSQVLAGELETLQLSIACLTPENLQSSWVSFEAGSISKGEASSVITYLYDLEPGDISQPLGQFNHTRSTKEDTLKMMRDINKELAQIGEENFKEQFDNYWPQLESKLKSVPDRPNSEPKGEEREDDNRISEVLEISRATYRGVRSMNSLLGAGSVPSGINTHAARLLMAMCAQWNELTLAVYTGPEYKHAKEYILNQEYARKDGKVFYLTEKGLDVVRSLVARTADRIEG